MGLNRWIGIGRLTRDPECRYANKQDGSQICISRFALAIGRRVKDETDYISCVAFGKQGEFVEKYLKQGTKIGVSGRIQTGSYKNKEGQTVYTTEVVVDEIEFAEAKSESKEETPATDGFVNVPEGIENELPFK